MTALGRLDLSSCMFVVTMIWDVPLNNALAAINASVLDAAPVWTRYLKEWPLRNHARTIVDRLDDPFILALQCAKQM